MNIKQIRLRNFRNVGELKTYEFKSLFTVVIGINGKGKSTILQALRVACGAFFQSIPGTQTIKIHSDEIRKVATAAGFLAEKRPVMVEASGHLENADKEETWRRRILENSNTNTSSIADIGSVRDWGQELYKQVNEHENDKIALPVIAFFGTNRIFGASRNTEMKKRTGREIFKDGYQNWYAMQAPTFQYGEWLSSYDIFLTLNKEYEGTKDAFFTAITTASRYVRDATFVDRSLWFRVQTDEDKEATEFLPIWLHSDGIKSYTHMVAELAYRCIVLNGYKGKDAVVESKGIVMIDELDLHLHPNWQRHIVNDLKQAFPKLQFVVATHSPFIVQSLNSDELINLDNLTPQAFAPNTLPLNKVATEIMDVDSIRSEDFEEKYEAAKQQLTAIENNNHELTTEDYMQVSKVLGTLLKEETNDAALKAFIEEQEKQESQ